MIKEMDDIFESDVDEVKSLSDLHKDSLDGLDDNLFVDSGGEEYENVKLLEEYESNDDDVFYSDSEDESPEARI
ncbi:hypothetical protein JRO89_XS03G0187500 [Xanthoceras sorbifolium]|uniref:Uncharacterized protein n=1 Tax=Xanthoceras sorbifolium TaxID=99658 RepID=A0ABQ8IB00_9ROSI|nr:hypothetical protein JRO89_XS03G0187500 [Xanthoceras sorbifolium]